MLAGKVSRAFGAHSLLVPNRKEPMFDDDDEMLSVSRSDLCCYAVPPWPGPTGPLVDFGIWMEMEG